MIIEIFDESKLAHLEPRNPFIENCAQDLIVFEANVDEKAICPITGREITLGKGNLCDQSSCKNWGAH